MSWEGMLRMRSFRVLLTNLCITMLAKIEHLKVIPPEIKGVQK